MHVWEVKLVKVSDTAVPVDPEAPVVGDLVCVGRCTVAIVPFPPRDEGMGRGGGRSRL